VFDWVFGFFEDLDGAEAGAAEFVEVHCEAPALSVEEDARPFSIDIRPQTAARPISASFFGHLSLSEILVDQDLCRP
jgi:hypothetical protein